ncbi:nucleoside phosphorylase [Croceitalea rosinachiae]|uniref:Uridine phosphorylase n=1 Tax=Croceitalea rosinachiae TaxID=3075596 RepID=A0ABU3ABT4_9FLAO|nr:nucleoside phosphorylase [Croceitalea sp. F388]MDT0607642.1 nucleoside phosphorylase [Croceitalea sp. F388]
MSIAESELILNPDGSIYHLNLLPEDIAPTVVTVGDPERVHDVSKYFDSIELKKGKREFITHTGILNKKRITVISTGIGTDNIDIVLNELDALVNIDLRTRKVKQQKSSLDIIRIGTSGAIQKDIPVDTFLLSQTAIGLDGLLHFYSEKNLQNNELLQKLEPYLNWNHKGIRPYAFDCDETVAKIFLGNHIRLGVTITNAGFYAPQGRQLRLKPNLADFHQKLQEFRFKNRAITNLEMETAGIYGLSKLLGHKAVSMNAILANRATGAFSKEPNKTVDSLIQYCLQQLT